ncbi:SPP1 family predicted phage head-tail adaptor [Ochrobactrum daejeonense]|uniref:SPP1 family predicted phage head-tail adaptor n=1 Tax=Brucella daejeonensis TaxID=659015 RepID=A0A7W9B1R2_9HYPH|nr:phage head closure protein [Brucella daejeonensis]MBB5704635.1 SPP1 family predicted phage head-tail adaptor [Brucella daejeonensis]NKB78716.1 phage head closure protein [Brucella daejeonensis]
MHIGNLDRRVTIERKTKTKTPTGSIVESWQAVTTVWAEIVKQSTSEFFTGYGEAESQKTVFRIRYRSDITTDDRISYNGTAYNLKDVSEIGRRDGLELQGVAVS